MTTVDEFLKALAMVESSDNPEAWGDAGRAMGRWQVHPDRLFDECRRLGVSPVLGETWDQLVGRVLRKMYADASSSGQAVLIAMFWHIGHWTSPTAPDWDTGYAGAFDAALLKAQNELP